MSAGQASTIAAWPTLGLEELIDLSRGETGEKLLGEGVLWIKALLTISIMEEGASGA